ncbi:MAG TPA: histidine phosphatase family protein, partial [Acidocella sp.]|nr:histidine phosphatase family protein [Acidocella sp.]
IRHGATNWTMTGRYQGQANPPLCGTGIAQAAALGLRMQAEPVRLIVSSPLLRARQTADILAEALGLSAPQIDTDLTEMNFGDWEGLTQVEVKAKWPQALRAWKHTPYAARPLGGEILTDMRERVRAGLHRWQGQPGSVVLVTHAVWIRLARIETGEATADAFRNIEVAPASVHWLGATANKGAGLTKTSNAKEISCVSP